MRRRSPFRAGVMVAAAVLISTLSACEQPQPGVDTATPEAGLCHAVFSPEEYDAGSESRPPVPCSERHTTQTFLVTTFPEPLASQAARPNQQQLKAAGRRVCTTEELRSYLSASTRDATTRLTVTSYFPSRDAWAAGARSVRCDVALTDQHGTPQETGLDLTGALAGPNSAVVRLCYRQELKDGVLSEDGADVPCSEPHTAEDISAWVAQDASLATPEAREARCLPYALEFLKSEKLPAGISVNPVIRTVGTARTIRCAVAPAGLQEPGQPLALTTGSLAPVHAPGTGGVTSNG
ncbi:septum formation family protein [Paenarthrobacter sp. JL.01a]|uniref:septum formation family protein n=1 Tax=Paenarthrobacter sp. JL.01a TaxID=2979324 RepID=UPI0021C97048|nr:septum formation family protein [Paenarthrobacter sp. JL.01a]UXM92733.1 septum formation family protein [Paenarthrobacter sp. JL.01a]